MSIKEDLVRDYSDIIANAIDYAARTPAQQAALQNFKAIYSSLKKYQAKEKILEKELYEAEKNAGFFAKRRADRKLLDLKEIKYLISKNQKLLLELQETKEIKEIIRLIYMAPSLLCPNVFGPK